MSYPESISKGTMVLDLGRAAFYNLKLYNLNNVVKVYTVRLETSKCSQPPNKGKLITLFLHVEVDHKHVVLFDLYHTRYINIC
jgi:hypothetical protein